MKILSIDFDYFVNAKLDIRNSKFPQAEDIVDPNKIKELWDSCYSEHPELASIGVIDELQFFIQFLKEHPPVPVLVAESHKDIYNFIFSLLQDSQDHSLSITNIDFHHDNYYMYGGRVTCANWLMKICELFRTKVLWVKREDSETSSLAGDFPYPSTTDIQSSFGHYDAIFLCMSPEWTPPHLRPQFNKMKDVLDSLNTCHNSQNDL